MSANEILLALEWLTTTLNADSTLTGLVTGGIWRGSAPVEAVPPYIVMNLQAGSDVLTMNGVRLYDSLLFQIKTIGPGTMTTTLLAAANEIDSLLKRTSGVPLTTDGLGAILACFRESPVQIDSLVNGELWTDLGGMYRIQLQQTS